MDAYRLINLISALVNIDRIVSPYMNLFRRFIPPLGGMDFSPIVGLFVLSFGERLIFRLLLGMA